MKPVISIKSLRKSFKGQDVLKGLDLNVNEGEIFGLIGKSGSGKTTLLRILLGFYKYDGGNVYINDIDISHGRRKIRQHLGFTTQDNSFYHKLTIEENLRYYGRMYGVKGSVLNERIEKLLDLVQLKKHRDKITDNISGGMKRRVDFAISLIHDPAILILDEPTTGLDPILRDSIWSLIKRIQEAGKTVFISSHLFANMEKYCTRIGFMEKGSMAAIDTPKKLCQKYRKKDIHDVFEAVVCGEKCSPDVLREEEIKGGDL